MGIAMELGQFTLVEYRSQGGTGRMEIYDGSCWVHKAPDAEHRMVAERIRSALQAALPENTLCTAPFFLCPLASGNTPEGDITDVVVPELLVLSERCQRIPGGCCGVPSLVVDLVSRWVPSTIRHKKQALYQKAGVPERWLVDPDRQEVQVFTSNGSRRYPAGQEVPLTFAKRTLALPALFHGIDTERRQLE